jgi:hypothetical protein
MAGKYMVVGISALVAILIAFGRGGGGLTWLIASDSERSGRMVIDVINTVRHSDTESCDINLRIL